MKSTRSSDMAVSFLGCHEIGPAAGHELIGSVGRHWLERIRPGGYQPARPATPQRPGAQTPQALPTAGLAGSVPISPRPQAGRTSAGTIRPQPDQRWSQGSNANARHRTVADSVEPIDADHSKCRTVSDGLDTGRACLTNPRVQGSGP